MTWLLQNARPPALIRWIGGWLYLAQRVHDLERRVAELERRR